MSDPEPVLIYRPPKPKVRRQKLSAFRCLAYTCLAFGIAIGCVVAYFLGQGAIGAIDAIRHPHRKHHLDTSQFAMEGDLSAVQPILEEDARFDIAATLWYSLPRDDQAVDAETDASEEEKTLMRYWGVPVSELRPIPEQEALFSEVIIRNASFKDKNLYRRVHYKLPLGRL